MYNRHSDPFFEALVKLTTSFAALRGSEYYEAICRYVCDHFGLYGCYVGRLDEKKKEVDVLAGWIGHASAEPFCYNLAGTPCMNVTREDFAIYAKDVRRLFEDDKLLLEHEIEAYAGASLLNREQDTVGIFVVLSKKPFEDPKLIENILKLYVGSLSAELVRFSAEECELDLRHIAYYDPLTKLPNRLLITDRIQRAIKSQNGEKDIVAICMMDLDGFKEVNDTQGHEAGDQVLIDVARRIESLIRPHDTVARLGGDEFVLVLSHMESPEDVGRILMKILSLLSKPYAYKDQSIDSISASVGVALYPDDNVDDDTLLRHADQAMYKAKENGKNQFYFFDAGEHKKVKANFKALKKIKRAIANGEFELYFQPKLNAHNLRIESAEVLTRWNHPILETLSPSEFLPLIEHDEVVYDFDEWVIRESLLALKRLRDEGRNINLSVNISPKQFRQRTFVSKVRDIIDKLGLDHSYLKSIEFEIVESNALESINYTNDMIRELKEIGVSFALDDFGTGYSSLTHLKELKIDTIKIDRSFITEMLQNTQDMAIVTAIISLSKVFHIEVVAEGVETIEQILMLLDLGCDTIQGYLLNKPMGYDKFTAYLDRYVPDPRWSVSFHHLPRRAEFELLIAQSNHKRWIELVIEALKNKDHEALPQLSHNGCRLGKWIKGRGKSYFSELASYNELRILHKKIHSEVSMLIRNLENTGGDLSNEDIQSILVMRNEMLLIMQRLKEEYKLSTLKKGINYG